MMIYFSSYDLWYDGRTYRGISGGSNADFNISASFEATLFNLTLVLLIPL